MRGEPQGVLGSCPTFYAWDGRREVLQAEGFSSAVSVNTASVNDIDARPLDYDELYQFARPIRATSLRLPAKGRPRA